MRRNIHSKYRPLRLGFVPLADCAPVVMAAELGLYAACGIEVELCREIGWATVRDKVVCGQLDAAAAPAGLVIAASCGLTNMQAHCLTGLVLNLHGNAITLSERLWRRGVRDGASLCQHVLHAGEPLTFGIVHLHSSHHFLLRDWLRSHGINPDRSARMVVVPPSQGPGYLRAGHLDGYCVGEPWNSLAVMARTGWVAATSPTLAPRHPEKVLMVRRDFAEQRDAEHLALIAALIQACAFCDGPQNRERIAGTLAQRDYVAAPYEALQRSLGGSFQHGHERNEELPDFHVFAAGNANEPGEDKALWIIRGLRDIVEDPASVPEERAGEWFRADIFQRATQLIPTQTIINS